MNNRGCIVFQGVKLDEKGHIMVDEFQNTTRPGVYAVGDVCGRALLTPGNGFRITSLNRISSYMY